MDFKTGDIETKLTHTQKKKISFKTTLSVVSGQSWSGLDEAYC